VFRCIVRDTTQYKWQRQWQRQPGSKVVVIRVLPLDRDRGGLLLHLREARNVLEERRAVEGLEQERITLLEIRRHDLYESV